MLFILLLQLSDNNIRFLASLGMTDSKVFLGVVGCLAVKSPDNQLHRTHKMLTVMLNAVKNLFFNIIYTYTYNNISQYQKIYYFCKIN